MTNEQLEKEIFSRRFEMYEEALKVFSNDLPDGKKVYGIDYVTGICYVITIFIKNNFFIINSLRDASYFIVERGYKFFPELYKYEIKERTYWFNTDAERVTALKEMLTHKPK